MTVARRPAHPVWPLLLALAVIAALAIGWVGYTASDDAAYYEAALKWLTAPPQPGDDHWGTRFPLILSLAAMLGVIGKGAAAMNATALIWYAIFLLSVRGLAMRIAGSRAGWIATMLMATLPVVVANATTVSCDLVEASFLILGIRLIGDVAADDKAHWKPAVAGLAFGAAILCRETTSLALFGFVPLFVVGRPVKRRALIEMGIACAALLGAEALYQYILTGDPLHRWTLAFHHDSHIDRAANEEGNFLVNPWIDPLLVLLINDDFALLFWLAAAALAARGTRHLSRRCSRRLAILVATALASFLLVATLYTKLVLNPRYFMLPALAAAIITAAWLDRLDARLRALLLSGAIGANLLMLSVENQHPRWAAQALVKAAQEHPRQMIVADPEIVHRAQHMLEWRGTTNAWQRIATPQTTQSKASPQILIAPYTGLLQLGAEADLPADAVIVARYPSPPTVLGGAVGRIGLASHLPGSVRHRLIEPNPTMLLWRTPAVNQR